MLSGGVKSSPAWDDGGCQGYPGHEIAEMALFRLYEATGEERYRDLAQRFLDRRGQRPYYFDAEHGETPAAPKDLRYQYHQAHLPVREAGTLTSPPR